MRPFEGIRIIDITHVLAGPFAAYQLALLGADVIKVEQRSDPDQSRDSGSDPALNAAQMGTGFLTQGSNKRAITLDLKTPAGREVLKKLVATADVLVENYRPGAFAALGLGYEDLSAINPRLIYASFSAFGQDGPRGQQTAYDHVIQATSGIMAMTGTPDVHPIKFGSPAIDYATGTMGAFALSAALFQRERTGRGQRIDMAMLDVAMILMASHLTGYLRNGRHPKPHGNKQPHATNSAYQTKDGLVMLGASNLRQQKRLWTVLEHPEMIKRTNLERDADHAREEALLQQIMPTRTAAEWEAYLQARHIPAAQVRTMGEASADPQLASRAVIHHHQGATGVEGAFGVPMAAFKFAHGGPRIDTPPPAVGEHNHAILGELGYSAAEIAQMERDGVL
ncbi:MAG: CoA transferase [Rhodospirillales bacterium]|nr:CoA transferase [Rhodospirillales bacterium]